MKFNKTIAASLIVASLLSYTGADAGPRKSSRSSSRSSGHYKNGSGSSHKGGHYKNSSTNDHYRKRK